MKLALALVAMTLGSLSAYSQDEITNSYASKIVSESVGVRVVLLEPSAPREGLDQGYRRIRLLIIQQNGVTYLEKIPHGIVREIGAQVLDLGKGPVIALNVFLQTKDQSGYEYIKLYRLAESSIGGFSDSPTPSSSGFTFVAGDPDAGGWKTLKVDIGKAGTHPDPKEGDHVLYMRFDNASSAYKSEDYTAGFAQKVVEGEYLGDQAFFQLNDDKVNLRQSPGTDAAVVATLKKDALFDIIDRTEGPQTIGGKSARWYRVLLADGKTAGWIFGGFLKKK